MPEYRDVAKFPGYRVGDDGSVWSRRRNGGDDRAGQVLTDQWHRLKGWVDKRRGKDTGYHKVGLMRDGRCYKVKVHTLVLNAFVGECPPGMEARHMDDDKSHNWVGNLAWGTPSENSHDRYRNKIMPVGEKHHRAVLKAPDIPEIRSLLKAGVSRRKIAARFGVSKGSIDAVAGRGDGSRTWKEVPCDNPV